MKRKFMGVTLLTMMVLGFAQNVQAAEEQSSHKELAENTYRLPMNRSDKAEDKKPEPRMGAVVSAANPNTPTKSFVDVSSHQGALSVENFKSMRNHGITGIVVKLTQGTWYVNEHARTQINNAKAAGMKVSAYHFSEFLGAGQAAAEADFFAAKANEFGLDKDTVMVNDIEKAEIRNASNTADSQAFAARLNQHGFNNTQHYASLSWLQAGGTLDGNALGMKNIWVAAYPYSVSTENYYQAYGAWQWSDSLQVPGLLNGVDISADYTGAFTKKKVEIPQASSPAGTTAMYRMYNSNSSEHFYTQNRNEAVMLQDKGWDYEGIGWNAPTTGEKVYRMYNPNEGDHHYTLNAAERDMLVGKGWNYEGEGWCSGGENELQRVYNPNAKSGAHHYTLNSNEKDNLVQKGWKFEGKAWNAK